MPERSLRSGLTLRVLAVALLLLVLDGIYSYALSAHFANLAYDRWLLDDAGSLAQALTVEGGKASVVLPRVVGELVPGEALNSSKRTCCMATWSAPCASAKIM